MALAQQPTGGVYFCVGPILASQVWLTLSYSHGACTDCRPYSGSHIVSWHSSANTKTWPPSPGSEVTLHSCHNTHAAQRLPSALTSVICSGDLEDLRVPSPTTASAHKVEETVSSPLLPWYTVLTNTYQLSQQNGMGRMGQFPENPCPLVQIQVKVFCFFQTAHLLMSTFSQAWPQEKLVLQGCLWFFFSYFI